MGVAFSLMPQDEFARVGVGARVSPAVRDQLRVIAKHPLFSRLTSQKGESGALAIVLEMASYAGWFDNPERFAVELLKARAASIERDTKKKPQA